MIYISLSKKDGLDFCERVNFEAYTGTKNCTDIWQSACLDFFSRGNARMYYRFLAEFFIVATKSYKAHSFIRRASGSVVGCGIGQPTRPGSILQISSGVSPGYISWIIQLPSACIRATKSELKMRVVRAVCECHVNLYTVQILQLCHKSRGLKKKLIVYVRLQ
jgi:hypothetical protein